MRTGCTKSVHTHFPNDLTHVSPVVKINSQTLILTTGKDGLLRAVDADSHEIIYSKPFTTRLNAGDPITTVASRTCPGPLGGNEWNGAAYSAKLRVVFVPATDGCATAKKDTSAPDADKEHMHGFYFGGEGQFDKWEDAHGWLTAFDAASGETKWRYAASKPIIGGVTTTAGNIVLAGELTGDFIVLDATGGVIQP
jgi:alcohol dehydrogenase (cytochrome c)